MLDSLMKVLENASGRSIGMTMAVIGIVVWWGVSKLQKGVRHLKGDDLSEISETIKDIDRPRRRLSLRSYHR